MIILDTAALIDFLSDGKLADTVDRAMAKHEGVISAVSVFELFAGVTRNEHIKQREDLVELLQIAPVTVSIARRAARLYTDLRGRGITIDNEDILIAATALERSLPVLTPNRKHFEHIAGLTILE